MVRMDSASSRAGPGVGDGHAHGAQTDTGDVQRAQVDVLHSFSLSRRSLLGRSVEREGHGQIGRRCAHVNLVSSGFGLPSPPPRMSSMLQSSGMMTLVDAPESTLIRRNPTRRRRGRSNADSGTPANTKTTVDPVAPPYVRHRHLDRVIVDERSLPHHNGGVAEPEPERPVGLAAGAIEVPLAMEEAVGDCRGVGIEIDQVGFFTREGRKGAVRPVRRGRGRRRPGRGRPPSPDTRSAARRPRLRARASRSRYRP